MFHTVLIIAHTTVGIAAFIFGLIVLRPVRPRGMQTLFWLYLGSLWLMVMSLFVVVGFDWMNLGLAPRMTFGALTLFAVYIGWRGWQAYRHLHDRTNNWKSRYIDDLGFTLIALFDGFVIILALDLGGPVWVAVTVGVLGVVVGRLGLMRTKRGVITS